MRTSRVVRALRWGGASLALACAVAAPAAADPSVAGVWSNQFGNVVVKPLPGGGFAGRMTDSFVSPGSCPGTSTIVARGQQVWTFGPPAADGSYAGTFNFIQNGSTPGCPGGNSEVASISRVEPISGGLGDTLRICHADPTTDTTAVFTTDGSDECEDDNRLGSPASATATHTAADYFVKMTGGKCVKSGPRSVNLYFRDDVSIPGAPGIGDPIVQVRFYDTGKLDKGYDIGTAEDFPNSQTGGHFTVESTTRKHLWVKVVMTSWSDKTYTLDSRHLPKSMLPKQFPQNCKP